MYDNKSLTRVRVWDLPTRIFHWALVLGIIALGITGTVGSFNAMVWHFRLGYAVLALLLFRILWGLVGGRWSRFGAFIYSPRTVIDYFKGKGKPAHAAGHSPIGAGSVFAMLGLLVAQVASGLVGNEEAAGPLSRFVSNATVSLASNYHANIGKWLLLALVLLHIVAIVYYLLRKQNLVGAMLHGDKHLVVAVPSSRDDGASRIGALVILLLCAGAAYWISTLDAVAS